MRIKEKNRKLTQNMKRLLYRADEIFSKYLVNRVKPADSIALNQIEVAIKSGNSAELSEIIKTSHITSINSICHRLENKTVLMLCCEVGSIECLEVLLDSGADPHIITESGNCALVSACMSGNIAIVNYLIKRCLVLNDDMIYRCTKVLPPSMRFDNNALKALYSHVVDINQLFQLACRDGVAIAVQLLFEVGADRDAIDNDGHDALYIAAEKCHLGVVKVLLEWQSDKPIATSSITAAFVVSCNLCLQYRLAGIKWMLRRADPEDYRRIQKEQSPDRIALIELLLRKGANIATNPQKGHTIIYQTCTYFNVELLKLIIQHRPEVKATLVTHRAELLLTLFFSFQQHEQDMRRQDTADRGQSKGDCDNTYKYIKAILPQISAIIQVLVDNELDLNAPFGTGNHILLIWASQKWINSGTLEHALYMEFIIWLLDHGVDINIAQPRSGVTPLIISAHSVRPDLLTLLLERGADVSQVDSVGRSVIDVLNNGWFTASRIKLCGYK